MTPSKFSSLGCELRIIQARNTEFKNTGNLFVRCSLSAGNNRRIMLNTREISAKSNHVWNESVSLECSGTEMCSMDNILQQETVVFELRWRSTVPVFGRIGGSQLLGRTQVPWKDVLESPNMELDQWVTVLPTTRHGLEGIKSPQLQVGIKIRVQADNVEMEKKRQKNRRLSRWDECGCESGHGHGCTCPDYEIFALAAALEAF
ncbi:uncharacterized protein [Pyrus communis]|uniref:uncharacterized protein n=1 Tax=Pyrus communis TaxID=23211 RepID=UPI0035C1FE15